MYGKIFEQELDSSIVELPLATRLLWHYLIMLADEDGNVDIAPSALARRVNIPLADVNSALQALSEPDPDSRSPGEEGRRIVPLRDSGYGWHLVNHGKYREIASRSDRRTYMRRYMRIYREERAGKQPVNSSKQVLVSQKQKHTQTQKEWVASGEAPPDVDPSRVIKWPGKRPDTVIPSALVAAIPDFPDLWRQRMEGASRKPNPSAEAKQLEGLLDRLLPCGAGAIRRHVEMLAASGYQGAVLDKLDSRGNGRPTVEQRGTSRPESCHCLDCGKEIPPGEEHAGFCSACSAEGRRRVEEFEARQHANTLTPPAEPP